MNRIANLIVMNPTDNVGIALRAIAAHEPAFDREAVEIEAKQEIPQGHKIALRPIAEGEPIMRLGLPVGIATAAIAPGHLVHMHNVRSQYLDNEEDHYE